MAATRAADLPLLGRRALVTGAASGIGRAIALRLAGAGADLAVHYNGNEEGATEVVAAIEAKGSRAVAVQADLRSSAAASEIVAEAARALGGDPDTVVNNAGGLVRRSSVETMADELWREVLELNLHSAFAMSRAAIPGLKRSGEGRIVNIASVAAFNGGGGGDGGIVPYAVAKAGLLSLTRGLARELAPDGVTVNAIAPGVIGDTPLHSSFTADETWRRVVAGIPVGRAGTTADIAEAVLFLVGPSAGFITGETIVVDGGVMVR